MKRKKKLDIIAIMLTIVLLILIGVNIRLLSNKLLAPVYANNKVKKEYEEIIAKRNEEIKKITDKKTDVEMAETELKEVKKMKEKQRMQYYFSKFLLYFLASFYKKMQNNNFCYKFLFYCKSYYFYLTIVEFI